MTNQTELYPSFIEATENLPYVANKFDIFKTGGTTNRLLFTDNQEAQIEPVATELTTASLQIDNVYFEQKAVSAEIPVPQQLINLSAIDFVNAAKGKVAKRILRKLQSQAFGQGNADGSEEFMQDIFQYNDYAEKTGDIAEFTDVKAMYADFAKDAENLVGAYVVVNSPTFLMNLKDDSGALVFKPGLTADGAIGQLYGMPVYVQNMNGKGDMVMMNANAYGVSIDDELAVEHLDGTQDSDLALKGAVVAYGEIMASGMVQNPLAIKVLKPAVGAVSVGETEFVATSVKTDEVENPTVEIAPKKKSARKVKGE